MELGDRMKKYENCYNSLLIDGLPVIVRIDGKSFHSFTKDCVRPFDVAFHSLMKDTLVGLVEEFVPAIGYCQSDEISLLFYQKTFESQLPFGGKVNKLNSVLASSATKYFASAQVEHPYPRLNGFPSFDCRCKVVPTKEEAANYFLWRTRDASKNSVSMAAQAKFSHAELQGKNCDQMQEMLFQVHGINWNDYPEVQKRGTWVTREKYDTYNCQVSTTTERTRIVVRSMPPFDKITNKIDVLFNSALPKVDDETTKS